MLEDCASVPIPARFLPFQATPSIARSIEFSPTLSLSTCTTSPPIREWPATPLLAAEFDRRLNTPDNHHIPRPNSYLLALSNVMSCRRIDAASRREVGTAAGERRVIQEIVDPLARLVYSMLRMHRRRQAGIWLRHSCVLQRSLHNKLLQSVGEYTCPLMPNVPDPYSLRVIAGHLPKKGWSYHASAFACCGISVSLPAAHRVIRAGTERIALQRQRMFQVRKLLVAEARCLAQRLPARAPSAQPRSSLAKPLLNVISTCPPPLTYAAIFSSSASSAIYSEGTMRSL